MKPQNLLYAWSCDFNSDTGEGILSQNFCKTLSTRCKVLIKLHSPKFTAQIQNSKIKVKKNSYSIKNYKILHYLYPFLGITYLWFRFLSGKKVMYLNYLPLWNFLIFFFLPPNTVLGPITGGSIIKKNETNFLRKYIFPKFYIISLFILNIRQKKILFSTNLLKKFLNKELLKKSFFLFCLNLLDEEKIIKVKNSFNYDILFYYNRHPLKFNLRMIDLINELSNYKIKIACFGEIFPSNKIINLGKVSRLKTWEIMNNSKLCFNSGENPLSIFLLDSIVCNLKIIVNSTHYKYLKKFFSNQNFIKYKDSIPNKLLIKTILKNIKSHKKQTKLNKFRNNIIEINKINKNYFSNLLTK